MSMQAARLWVAVSRRRGLSPMERLVLVALAACGSAWPIMRPATAAEPSGARPPAVHLLRL